MELWGKTPSVLVKTFQHGCSEVTHTPVTNLSLVFCK